MISKTKSKQIQDWQRDTIVAPATAPGESGVGIIRLSGAKSPDILKPIWKSKIPIKKLESHKLFLGNFICPHSQEKIDSGLLVWMRAPHSFTGEEVFELQVHGGPLIMHRLLEACLNCGARLAEAGEFTRRAFLNGKMDLLQAEAIGELIHAKSQKALSHANAQLEGKLSHEIKILRDQLIRVLALVEAAIDFPEEDIEILRPEEVEKNILSLQNKVEQCLERFHIGKLIREGIRVALVGKPNVGKSSLLNYFLGEDRAIVHDLPGTTRDVVDGMFQMKGLAWQIFDTAGIRQTTESVEREGIRRSQTIAQQADLTLCLFDSSQDMTEEDREVLSQLNSSALVIASKADLSQKVSSFPESWKISKKWRSQDWHFISTKTGFGIEKLKQSMLEKVGLSTLSEKSYAYLNNARHRKALHEAKKALTQAQKAIKLPTECLAADLKHAASSLESILGKIDQEEVLDQVFSQFCIGK